MVRPREVAAASEGSGMAAAAALGLIQRGRIPFGPLPFKVSDRDRDRTYELVTARRSRMLVNRSGRALKWSSILISHNICL